MGGGQQINDLLFAINVWGQALAVRNLAPDAELVFLADNDIKPNGSNPGLIAATEAARAVGGFVAVPELDGQKCDFWDVWHQHGADAMRNALKNAIPPVANAKAANDKPKKIS